jgi:hypothetical protein
MGEMRFRFRCHLALVLTIIGSHVIDAVAQDVPAVWSQSPVLTAVLRSVLHGSGSFIAQAEMEFIPRGDGAGKKETATGVFASERGRLRWDVAQALGINSACWIATERSALLLPDAKAYSDAAVPEVRVLRRQAAPPASSYRAKHALHKEALTLHVGRQTIEATVWRSHDKGKPPQEIRALSAAGVWIIRLRQPRRPNLTTAHFTVPAGYKRYPDPYDMVSAIAWDKLTLGLGSSARP